MTPSLLGPVFILWFLYIKLPLHLVSVHWDVPDFWKNNNKKFLILATYDDNVYTYGIILILIWVSVIVLALFC